MQARRFIFAGMAKLVDALGLGPSGLMPVGVRVSLSAPFYIKENHPLSVDSGWFLFLSRYSC